MKRKEIPYLEDIEFIQMHYKSKMSKIRDSEKVEYGNNPVYDHDLH